MKNRRHHNNYGKQTVLTGRTADQAKRMAAKLGVAFGPTRRLDGHGPVKFMAQADGYVMVRRPGCIPFVMQLKEWDALPAAPTN